MINVQVKNTMKATCLLTHGKNNRGEFSPTSSIDGNIFDEWILYDDIASPRIDIITWRDQF